MDGVPGFPTPVCAAAAASSRPAAAGCTPLPRPPEPPALTPPAPAPASGRTTVPESPRPQSIAPLRHAAAQSGVSVPPLAVGGGYQLGAPTQTVPTAPVTFLNLTPHTQPGTARHCPSSADLPLPPTQPCHSSTQRPFTPHHSTPHPLPLIVCPQSPSQGTKPTLNPSPAPGDPVHHTGPAQQHSKPPSGPFHSPPPHPLHLPFMYRPAVSPIPHHLEVGLHRPTLHPKLCSSHHGHAHTDRPPWLGLTPHITGLALHLCHPALQLPHFTCALLLQLLNFLQLLGTRLQHLVLSCHLQQGLHLREKRSSFKNGIHPMRATRHPCCEPEGGLEVPWCTLDPAAPEAAWTFPLVCLVVFFF